MHHSLRHTSHRPWPLRDGPWWMRQTWRDLLFAHWPVPAAALRRFVPEPLAIDEHGGSSWVGVVPFRMTGVMLRGLPDMPGISAFPELNLRLYVTYDGKPGVWFVSLDATNALAVLAARASFHLPYYRASIRIDETGSRFRYTSLRRSEGARVAFDGEYGPTAPPFRATPGSLEHFLVERYCLYAASKSGAIYRGDIHHAPWDIQLASATIGENTIATAQGIAIDGPPAHLLFVKRIDAVVWPLARLVT